jgi:hypothetical protein
MYIFYFSRFSIIALSCVNEIIIIVIIIIHKLQIALICILFVRVSFTSCEHFNWPLENGIGE